MSPGYPFALRSLTPILMSGFLLSWTGTAIAQIRPDDTLGDERSRLTPGVDVRGDLADLIEGGAQRGNSLFHSFEDFSVQDLQRVYFANPDGIANILSRITGSSRSDIMGTLGVDGTANLFLINPNGIVFGPNAVLDVDGAFLASTADHILFDDGSLFSAVDPDAPPLVTVNIPIGVQFGPNPPASILNEANLEAGGDLTLAAVTITDIGNLTAGGQVQLTEAVPSQSQDVSLDPQVDTGPNTSQMLSGPDDPFEISWITPAETGIQPDDTLGAESSVLVEEVEVGGGLGDRVDGGAIRGTNLFHSFTAFNVEEGDRAYFSNPVGVETILSRVTGTGRSDILGTLGVDGSADLFMVNPNGMVFGPNAQLDVDGSFLASTADAFTFGEGIEFRASEPNEAPIVAVNIPVGVEFGEETSQRLINQASLETTGDITLSAQGVASTGSLTSVEGTATVDSVAADAQIGNVTAQRVDLHADETLSLIESEVISYGDLAVQADGTIHIRDSVDIPFLAASSGNMVIQGNEHIDILALNHPGVTPFQSYGNLTLASDGVISGDAHFQSVGNYSIVTLQNEPANFISLFDPIIRSNGGVTFGNYTGTSLLVEAVGGISGGEIFINGPDNSGAITTANTTPEDFNRLTTLPTLILRAGLPLTGPEEFSIVLPPPTENPPPVPPPGGISVGRIITFFNDNDVRGPVELSAQNGDININQDGTQNIFAIAAESVRINTFGAVNILGGVTVRRDDAVDSGNIEIGNIRQPSSVTVSNLSTRQGGTTGNGGNIIVETSGILTVTGGFNRDMGGQTVDINPDVTWAAIATQAINGNSGNIDIQADGGIVTFAEIVSANDAAGLDDNGPRTTVDSDGGNINILAENGFINVGSIRSFTESPNGNAGFIEIEALNQITTGDVQSTSIGGTGRFGNGFDTSGDITITSNAGGINTTGGSLDSSTRSGDAGDITLNAAGDVFVGSIFSGSRSAFDDPDAGGNSDVITLGSDTRINITNASINSSTQGARVDDLNLGNFIINAPIIEIVNSFIETDSFNYAIPENDEGANAGDVRIGSSPIARNDNNEITITNSTIRTVTHGFHGPSRTPGDAGDITIGNNMTSVIEINNSSARAETHARISLERNGDPEDTTYTEYTQDIDYSAGAGGSVAVLGETVVVDNSNVSTTTFGTGTGGGVSIEGQIITLRNGTNIIAETSGAVPSAAGGDITIGVDAMQFSGSTISRTIEINNTQISTNTGLTQAPVQDQDINDPNNPNAGDSISFLLGDEMPGDEEGLDPEFGFANAGDLTIGNATTSTVDILNGSTVRAESFGEDIVELDANGNIVRVDPAGDAGFVTVLAAGDVTINNSILANRVNDGDGQTLSITGGTVSILNGSRVNADSRGGGNSGSIQITSTTNIDGSRDIGINNSRVSARAIIPEDENGIDEVSTANAGTVTLTAQNQGDIEIADNIGGRENGISSNAENGLAGDITLDAGTVTLTNAQVLAETTGGGTADNQADITFQNLESLTVNQGVISSSTDTGVAGTIRIDATEAITVAGSSIDNDRAGLFVEATDGGDAGNIIITTPQLTATANAEIRASSDNRETDPNNEVDSDGQAGFIEINAGDINLDTALISTSNEDGPNGEGLGDIRFQDVDTFDAANSLVTASTNSGFAGSVTINAGDDDTAAQSVSFSGTIGDFNNNGQNDPGDGLRGAIAAALGDGSAGDITINSEQLTISNSAIIGVSSEGENPGNIAGDITINATDVTINSNSEIVARTNAGGILDNGDIPIADPANITLNGLETLTVTNGLISSSTQTGIAGDVVVNASESITLDGQITVPASEENDIPQRGIGVQALGDGGVAGNIELTTPLLTVANGAQISASTDSQTVPLRINDSDPAGDITINAADINLLGTTPLIRTGIISGTTGADNAGSITVQPDTVEDTLAITFAGGAEISATTEGSGNGGDIILNGEAEPDVITEADGTTSIIYRGAVSLAGEGIVEASAEEGATGNAGGLQVNTQQFNLGTGVQILAESFTSNGGNVLFQTVDDFVLRNARISVSSDSGQPGGIVIQARNSALISGTLDIDGILEPGGLFANNISSAEFGDTPSGLLTLSTPTLIVENGAQIATSTNSGIGGTVGINAESIILRDNIEDEISTGLFSLSTTGNSGDIRLLEVEELIIQGDSQISTTTVDGVAGSISILRVREEAGNIPVGSILLEGEGSEISAEATGELGRADDLTLNVEDLDVLDGGRISTSNVASTRDGNIVIDDLETLTVAGGQIAASTRRGNAGNVTLNATTAVNISGQLEPGEAAGVSAEASEGGNAGRVTITTPLLTVTDNGAVTVSSADGAGTAGNITVNSTAVTVADGGEIAAETDAGGMGNPANINLNGLTDLTLNSGTISSSTNGGVAGSVVVDSDRIFIDNGLISSSAETGNAGSITVEGATLVQLQNTAPGDEREENVGIQAIARQGGNAGAVNLTTETLTIANGAAVAVSSEDGRGTAGNITIDSTTVTLTDNGEISAETDAGGTADTAANISLRGLDNLTVENSLISSSTATGSAGNVTVIASESVTLSGTFAEGSTSGEPGGLRAIATQGGDAGEITVSTERLSIADNAAIAVSSENGSGTAGNITVNSSLIDLTNGGRIAAETDAGGTAENSANIRLNGAQQLTVDSGSISSSTQSGVAGQVTVDADQVVVNNSGQIRSSSEDGTAGRIAFLGSDRLTVDDSLISSSTQSGVAGQVEVTATQVFVSNGGGIESSSTSGEAGSIAVTGGDRIIVNNGRIESATDDGQAGNIILAADSLIRVQGNGDVDTNGESVGVQAIATQGGNAGEITVDTNQLAITNGAAIAVSSDQGNGFAGSITIDARDVNLRNNATISAETDGGGTEDESANIRLTGLDRLRVIDSRISSATASGVAGSVQVGTRTDPANSVLLRGTVEESRNNGNTLTFPAGLQAIATDGGDAGLIRVYSDDLTIADGAAIAVSSQQGSGLAGSINVTASTITLRENATISAETDAGGRREPANIRLNGVDSLQVLNSRISTATEEGVAGSVQINTTSGQTAADTVVLRGSFTETRPNGRTQTSNGGIEAIATNGGNAGRIQVNTGELLIEDNAAIAVSSDQGNGLAGSIDISAERITLNNEATISAETDAGGRRNPANIRLTNVDTLDVSNNSQISASTDTGTAGDIRINTGEAAAESIIVSNGSRIAVEARDDESIALGEGGIAGDLQINTGDLIVRENSELSVSSPRGEAGNLIVDASFVNLDNGRLTAVTGGGDNGANIRLTINSLSDDPTAFLRLENESLISASANGDADGGNVTIVSDFIFAFFPTGEQGSDIIANAVQGNGGIVDITALGIFGIQFREQATPLNDITATSQGGGAGVVALNTPGIDPVRGFSALPVSFVDLSGLVGQSCAANLSARGDRVSSFTLTGQGGVPVAPTDALGMIPDLADWVTVADESVAVSTRPLPAFTLPQMADGQEPLVSRLGLCVQAYSRG